jgi:hypothetical protein
MWTECWLLDLGGLIHVVDMDTDTDSNTIILCGQLKDEMNARTHFLPSVYDTKSGSMCAFGLIHVWR